MPPEHPRSGIAHDDSNLFAVLRLITMDRTIHAGRFLGSELAAIQPHPRVVQQRLAIGAQRLPHAVPIATMKGDHGVDRFKLSFQTRVHGFGSVIDLGLNLRLFAERCFDLNQPRTLNQCSGLISLYQTRG